MGKSSRMPETFVMGHMLVVAICRTLCPSDLILLAGKRLENNASFSGLYVTRGLDKGILCLVKNSVKGLNISISEIEDEQMRVKLFIAFLPPARWR